MLNWRRQTVDHCTRKALTSRRPYESNRDAICFGFPRVSGRIRLGAGVIRRRSRRFSVFDWYARRNK